MDFFSIGSLSGYTKNLKLQTKWNIRKAGGDVDGMRVPFKPRKSAEASAYQQIIDRQNAEEDNSDRMAEIMNKVSSGGKLSREEKEYLKMRAPEVYRSIENAEQEQKEYEQELKRCRTKEEVQRAKLSHMSASMTRVNAVKNNPNIPEEKKKVLLTVENQHLQKLGALERKFVKHGDYARLPTDAEQEKAEREERQARTGSSESSGQLSETTQRKSMEEPTRDTSAAAGDVVVSAAKQEKTPVTDSEEQRKVRRARRKAAFAVGESEDLSFFEAEA